MTKAASLLADLVSRYGSLRSNPAERSGALAEGNPVAAKKKRRTAKQKAATKRMIKARKKSVRATKKAKKTVKRRVKRAKKKVAVKRRKKKATVAATPSIAEAFGSGGEAVAAKKKRKSRKTGKRRAKATRKKTRRTRRRSKKSTGSPRRRRRRSRKKSSARRGVSVTRGGRTRTVRLKGSPKVKYIMVQEAKKTTRRKKRRSAPKRRRKGGRKKGSRSRKRNPIELNSPQMLANPTYGGLFSNAGPYNSTMLKNLGVAAVGIGFGLLVAEMVDRAVATRTPADDGTNKANHPWYGRNAVAAIQRRPDAMRYGAQIGGAAVSIGVAYLSRNLRGIGRIVPFLAGGMAVAFVANAAMKLFNWEIAPRIFKVTKPDEMTLGNRLFVLEQVETQDKVDELFNKWGGTASLSANQLETPSIQGPLSADTSQDILTLAGKPKPEGLPLGLGGRPGPLVETGRVGQCTSCNGMNGCFASCPGLKADCASCKPSEGSGDSSTSTSDGGGGGGGKRCRYIVQPGDDVFEIARASGIDMNTVNLLNTGTPDQYWVVGSSVVLPNQMCNLVRTRIPTPNIPTGTPLLPQTPPPPVTTTTVVLNRPTDNGSGGPGYRAVQPIIPNGGGGREVFTVVQPTQPWVPPMIAGIEENEDEDSIL